MKKVLLLCALGLVSLCTFAASGDVKPNPTTIPVNVGIELSDQTNVTKLSDVYFGGVYIPHTGDAVVTMDAKGVVTVTSGETTLYNQVSQRLGQIKVIANEQTNFHIDMPETVDLKNTTEPDKEGKIPPLKYTPVMYDLQGQVMDPKTEQFPYTQKQYSTLGIAGTVNIPADAYRGIYSGEMDVTVSWL